MSYIVMWWILPCESYIKSTLHTLVTSIGALYCILFDMSYRYSVAQLSISYCIYDTIDMVETQTYNATWIVHHMSAIILQTMFIHDMFIDTRGIVRYFLCIEASNIFLNIWLKTRNKYIYIPFALTFVPLRTIGMYMTIPTMDSYVQTFLVYSLWIMSCIHACKVIRKCPYTVRRQSTRACAYSRECTDSNRTPS